MKSIHGLGGAAAGKKGARGIGLLSVESSKEKAFMYGNRSCFRMEANGRSN